ncbi:MFS general substrate transporter [Cristinia sonorae]|uniref:MFS general substrate transporter n=1 Tax=Cristinia sonorae TaxID=1940300 RepID=A0A8K0UVB5_9AGAR|nr:MFS general substrate transporter [Cristinia sonorae]
MISRDEEATLADASESQFAVHHLEEVTEPIDPRISPVDRPSQRQLDEPLVRQLSDYVHAHHNPHKEQTSTSTEKQPPSEDEVLYIEFEKGDPRDPINFTRRRKWAITLPATFFTFLSAAAASTYAMGWDSMIVDLNCTRFQATVGLSLFALGFSVIPLVSASFSEEFGRHPLYVITSIVFGLMHMTVALSKNIQTVHIARFLAGAFGSTGSTMVGGTIADIWLPYERGLPMAIFSVAAIGGTGLGPVAAGWVEMNPHLRWRWIQWIHLILTGTLTVAILVFMRETRSAVLLTRLAKKMRKDSGDLRYRARVEDERASLKTLIYISCTRPLYLLFTEPVVASFSIWVGFAWGILYVLIESITPVFKTLHNFNTGQTGTVFVTFFIGSLMGIGSDRFQEILYRKNVGTRGPEARLYHAMLGGIVFPAAMFIYAWCTFPDVHWISLVIAITLFIWACFGIYLTVFTYLADCYGPFASSALAGQSLCRNLAGMAFPLFTQQMYDKLSYKWANTLFALIATIMIPIPFVLFKWGPKIRERSKFASQVMHAQKS